MFYRSAGSYKDYENVSEFVLKKILRKERNTIVVRERRKRVCVLGSHSDYFRPREQRPSVDHDISNDTERGSFMHSW